MRKNNQPIKLLRGNNITLCASLYERNEHGELAPLPLEELTIDASIYNARKGGQLLSYKIVYANTLAINCDIESFSDIGVYSLEIKATNPDSGQKIRFAYKSAIQVVEYADDLYGGCDCHTDNQGYTVVNIPPQVACGGFVKFSEFIAPGGIVTDKELNDHIVKAVEENVAQNSLIQALRNELSDVQHENSLQEERIASAHAKADETAASLFQFNRNQAETNAATANALQALQSGHSEQAIDITGLKNSVSEIQNKNTRQDATIVEHTSSINSMSSTLNTVANYAGENKQAIATLNANASVKGSVDQKIADAINAFATALTDDGIVNTYAEALNYIATHGAEFTALLGVVTDNSNRVDTNQQEIAKLVKAVALGLPVYGDESELPSNAANGSRATVYREGEEWASVGVCNFLSTAELEGTEILQKKGTKISGIEFYTPEVTPSFNTTFQNSADYALSFIFAGEDFAQQTMMQLQIDVVGGKLATVVAVVMSSDEHIYNGVLVSYNNDGALIKDEEGLHTLADVFSRGAYFAQGVAFVNDSQEILTTSSFSSYGFDEVTDSVFKVKIFTKVVAQYIKSSEGWKNETSQLDERLDSMENKIANAPYLPISGGTVTGDLEVQGATKLKDWSSATKPLNLQMGEYAHIAKNGLGTAGYVKVATITINRPLADEPIYFEIMQRVHPCVKLRIQFNNSSSLNPSLAHFTHQGTTNSYYFLHPSSSSVWDFYVKKIDSWSAVTVSKVYIGGYCMGIYQAPYFTITWQDELVTAVPEGSVAAILATEDVNISGNAATATKLQTTRKIGLGYFNGSTDVSLNTMQGMFSLRWVTNTTQWQRILRFKTNATYQKRSLLLAVADTETLRFQGILKLDMGTLATTSDIVNDLKWLALSNRLADYTQTMRLYVTHPTDTDEYCYFDLYANAPQVYTTMYFNILRVSSTVDLTFGGDDVWLEKSEIPGTWVGTSTYEIHDELETVKARLSALEAKLASES